MTQKELVESLTKKTGLTAKESRHAVQALADIIAAALLKGESVRTSLGTFSVNRRAARKGRNPRTGEAVKIKASKSVRFRAARPIKDKLNRIKRKAA